MTTLGAAPPSNVISTWILLDNEESASQFPQAGRGSSANGDVHQIYWRCVTVFFAVARRTAGAGFKLRLYTGDQAGLAAADPFVAQSLMESGVEVHVVPLEHLPPVGYYGRFRNQFYIFDILNRIAAENTQDSHLILDSDCLCLRPLSALFQLIQEKGALTLATSYSPDQDINGLTRLQMQDIFAEMSGSSCEGTPPAYYGGEFYASTSQFIRKMAPLSAKAWQDSLDRFGEGKLKLNEEAHLLSYLFHQLGVESGTGNPFIKRIWTGLHFRNGTRADARLPIVHLPGEKRFGFVTLYKLIQRKTSWFYLDPVDERWVRRVQKIASVPRPTPIKLLRELTTYAWSRIVRLHGGD